MSTQGVGRTERLDRSVGAAIIAISGAFVAAIPAYDVWTDIAAGKSPTSTVIENAPLFALCGGVVLAAVWLYRSDWSAEYVRTIVGWMLTSGVFVSALFVFIVSIQLYLQDEVKPFIIAADAMVVAAVGGLLIGVRTAERKRAEHNRFDALFDNVPNPIVETRFRGDTAIAERINPAFTEVFGFERSEVVGEPLADFIVPPDVDIEPLDSSDEEAEASPVEVLDQETIELETIHGRREFIRLTVPGDANGNNGYGIYIDVTSQKQRQERLGVLARILRHDIRNRVSVILGYTQHLADKLDGPAAEKLERIADAATDLANISERTRIAEDLAVESTEQHTVSLLPTVEAVIDELTEEHDSAHIEADISEDACVRATSDLGTALAEIIENAIVHNDGSTPEVRLTAEKTYDDEYYEIRISDNGPGIDPKLYEVVVGERERSNVNHSNGLGIWLAYWVCRASGGELEFETDDDGTDVILRVPATEPTEESIVPYPHSSRRPET